MYAFSTAVSLRHDGFRGCPQVQQQRVSQCRLSPHRTASPSRLIRLKTPCMSSSPSSGSRRDFLKTLGLTVGGGCVLGMVPFAEEAHALSKKRILAKAGPEVKLPSGVMYRDITIGKGYSPRTGDTVAIHYSLFFKDLEVESSRESQGLAASPLGFTFGTVSGPGSILPGINQGMDGMKVGGLRLITIPPELAFGEKGKQPLIPANATVDFAVSLLSCKRQGTNPNSMIDPKAQSF